MVFADYDLPVRNFKQLINEDKRGNPYYQQFISNTNNSIQLSWEHVHYYYGYELYWWTDVSGQKKIFIQPETLEKTRFHDYEYYSFVDNTPNVFVYYFQIEGWLYGRGHGKKSKVLKALKPYKGMFSLKCFNYKLALYIMNLKGLYAKKFFSNILVLNKN